MQIDFGKEKKGCIELERKMETILALQLLGVIFLTSPINIGT